MSKSWQAYALAAVEDTGGPKLDAQLWLIGFSFLLIHTSQGNGATELLPPLPEI